MKRYTCHVCGFEGLDEEPYLESGTIPSHNICDCCGCQFGYDDNEEYRKSWVQSGGKWFCPDRKPNDWNLKEQLKRIGIDV